MQHAFGYSGDVFFYRAGDLLDNRYENNDQEVYDTFLDEGHSTEGDWNTLVWYLDVEISQGGSGSLSMKDHAGASPLTRAWGSSATEKGAIGTIPSNTGEYSLDCNRSWPRIVYSSKSGWCSVSQWTL